jgi:hypothetical protein
MWEPQRLTTLCVSTARYGDNFAFYLFNQNWKTSTYTVDPSSILVSENLFISRGFSCTLTDVVILIGAHQGHGKNKRDTQ